MNNLPIDHLPLYLQSETQPIYAYIINNNVICLQESEAFRGVRTMALHPLMELYATDWTRKSIPMKLQRFLKEISKDYWKEQKQLCICGDSPGGPQISTLECLALNLDLEKKKDENKIVIFDFVLIEHIFAGQSSRNYLKVKKLPWSIELTTEAAFLHFANMNVNSNFTFWHLSKIVTNTEKAKRALEKQEIPVSNQTLIKNLMLFCIEYCEWVQEKLVTGKITCSQVLQASGALILAAFHSTPVVRAFYESAIENLQDNYDKVTKNQKIQYLLFLRNLKEIVKPQDNFEISETLLNKMRQELITPYPYFDATKENTFSLKEVFSRYEVRLE